MRNTKREKLMLVRVRSANKTVYHKVCPTCSGPFDTTSAQKLQCSDYCRDKAAGSKKDDDGRDGDVIATLAEKFEALCKKNEGVKIEMVGEIL